MIEIFDENFADEFGVRDPQTGTSSVKVAHHFAVLFDQVHVVFRHVLNNKYSYYSKTCNDSYYEGDYTYHFPNAP